MADSNHHAYVVPVVLEPHPDPETTRLSVVRVNAYTCVVATEDWKGVTKAIYIQPDTVVPDWPEFAFLKRNNSARAKLDKEFIEGEQGVGAFITKDEYDIRLQDIEAMEAVNIKNLRITAKRLRGVQSFGMLWPTTECHLCVEGVPLLNDGKSHFFDGVGELPCIKAAEVGDDLWDSMFLKRYEPPMPLEAGGEMDSAPDLPWLHEYDVENYYNWPNVLVPGEEVVATEKLDGANSRFVWAKDRVTGEYRMFVGGRTEWKRESPTNMWWRALRFHPWLVEFCTEHPDWIVYGEVFGNVQKLKYGVKPNQPNKIRVFDVLKVSEFATVEEREAFFSEDQRAPVVYRGEWDAEKLKELSRGNSTFDKHLKEGIVVEPVVPRYDIALGRVKLKLVSFDLLSKG
jgi:RNA ligase (TIGR02306 family)